MANQDEEPDAYEEIAWSMFTLAEALDELISEEDEDTEITVLVDTRNWLLDRANIFAPPGAPKGGYPKDGCPIINLEAWRARKR